MNPRGAGGRQETPVPTAPFWPRMENLAGCAKPGVVYTEDLLLALPGSRPGQSSVGSAGVAVETCPNSMTFRSWKARRCFAARRDLNDRGTQAEHPYAATAQANRGSAGRFSEARWRFILSEAGTQVAVEACRWPTSARCHQGSALTADDVPTQVFLAYTQRERIAENWRHQYLTAALASFRWDNVVGRTQKPRRNPTPWFDGDAGPKQTLQAAVDARPSAKNSIEKALGEG